ncbi:MAG: ribosome biogenesis GTPase YlqF [Bacilli bacterium]|jgi:ribosome biogenesis GTPase A|nr:ribosome biogenesis GTPase YlqF [Bacilli bacterium]
MAQLKNVHYYPGHMKKAQDSLTKLVRLCDLVIEIADARAPLSTRNPALKGIIGAKPHVLLLSKLDKADPAIAAQWKRRFLDKEGLCVLLGDLKKERFRNIEALLGPQLAAKRAKEARLGMKRQPARLLVMGIPNVGKSTLINSLAGHKLAKVANRPGVTRAEQWIKIGESLLLLDTPGILPMNYPDGSQAVRLALLGSIKEEVLPNDDLAVALLSYLKAEYPRCLGLRYGLADISSLNGDEILSAIAVKRGFLLNGGAPDESKAALALIKDFQGGELGRLCLERP